MVNTLFNNINPYIRYVNHLTDCNNLTHKLPWRVLYDYELLFITKGEIIVETKTNKYVVKENQFHFMSPNIEHTRYFSDGISCDYYNLHFDVFYDQNQTDFSADSIYRNEENASKDILRRNKQHLPTLINAVSSHHPSSTVKLFEQLFSAYKDTRIAYKHLLLKSICLKIIHQVILSCEKSNVSFFNLKADKHGDIINKFLHFVENNYQLDITVNDFISTQGLSLGYFVHIFKDKKSITPNEYIIQYRITQAKMLLTSGSYYVYEIAQMVGYPNEFYFSRIFKKKEGCSPSQYLEKMAPCQMLGEKKKKVKINSKV